MIDLISLPSKRIVGKNQFERGRRQKRKRVEKLCFKICKCYCLLILPGTSLEYRATKLSVFLLSAAVTVGGTV